MYVLVHSNSGVDYSEIKRHSRNSLGKNLFEAVPGNTAMVLYYSQQFVIPILSVVCRWYEVNLFSLGKRSCAMRNTDQPTPKVTVFQHILETFYIVVVYFIH
jgi:hypothetical protein